MPQNLVTFHRCHSHTKNIFNFQCIVWTVIMFYKRHSWSQLPDSVIGSVRDMRMSHTSKIQSAFEQFPCEHNTSLGSMDYLLSRGSTVQLYIWTVLNIDYRSRGEGVWWVFPPPVKFTHLFLADRKGERMWPKWYQETGNLSFDLMCLMFVLERLTPTNSFPALDIIYLFIFIFIFCLLNFVAM